MRQHIVWIDWLRVTACLLVVVAHCVDPFMAQFETNPEAFVTAAFWGSSTRACVPLFLMVSAVLLLPVGEPMGLFYRKRIGRVVWPLAVWSLVTPVLFYLYVQYSGTTHPGIISMGVETFGGAATAAKMGTWLLNFNYDIIPFWYLYMLVGIYLILPIVSPWLREASKKDLQIFLGLWLASMCVPYLALAAPALGYVGNYGHFGLFGECTWNPYGTFYYFSGFLGYAVLAFYWKRFPLTWSMARRVKVAVPLFLVGYAVTAYGFLKVPEFFPGDFAALEIPWFFCSPNVCAMTVAVYLIFTGIKSKPRRWLSQLAGLTFGVYLTHFIFVHITYDWFIERLDFLPPALQIPVMGVTAFILSAGLVWFLSRFSGRRYFIG